MSSVTKDRKRNCLIDAINNVAFHSLNIPLASVRYHLCDVVPNSHR